MSFAAALILCSIFQLQFASASDPLLDTIKNYLTDDDFASWITHWRRDFHSFPELGYREFNTSTKLRRALEEMGIEVESIAPPGLVATIGVATKHPLVALRADMDALPIHEETNLSFKSQVPGVMHACGHDSHMAMLLGAARILKSIEDALPGQIRLIFQPAEEGMGGGRDMVRQGALDKVGMVFALHVDPGVPSGHVRSRTGVIMAASDRFEANITGVGGHAAAPHLSKDPVVAAAAAVMALQPLISRETDPLLSGVVTVAKIRSTGSGANNVIPEQVQLSGTIRAFDKNLAERLQHRVGEIISGAAGLYGCSADITWSEVPYPPVVNDRNAVETALDAASMVFGESKRGVFERPYAYAEDFAFMAEAVPGALMFLGVNDTVKEPGSAYGLHNPRFTVEESVLPQGAVLHAAMALESLKRQQTEAEAGGGGRDEL